MSESRKMNTKELKLEINALKREILSLKHESSLFYGMLEIACTELEKCDKEKHHMTLVAFKNTLNKFKQRSVDFYESDKLNKE